MGDRDDARRFVEQYGLTWPNAYGVGALMRAGPVVYVVGADGRVAWSDQRARLHHDVAHFVTSIEAALDRALADTATHRRSQARPRSTSRETMTMPSHGG